MGVILMVRIIRTLLPLLLVFGAVALGQAAETGKGFGDGHDGNRASTTHLIKLFDENDIQIKATDPLPRPHACDLRQLPRL